MPTVLRRLPLAAALLALLVLAVSGPGTRVGLWDYRVAFALLRGCVYGGLAAAALAAVALAWPRWRHGQALPLALALCAALFVAWLPWQFAQRGRAVPPIHDITTDLADPPAFVAVLPLRAGAANPVTYGGADVAAAQRRGYPDIAPLQLADAPGAAFARAVDAARAMGWEVVAADASAGRIEAVATTPWFAFRDDVVVRITAAGGGSRVDVRSLSRVGRSDLGTNARRVRDYLARLAPAPG